MDEVQDSATRENLARLWGKAEASVQAFVFSAIRGFQPARQAALEHCLEKLPDKSRRLLDLRYVEETSIESMAQQIKSTAGTVRVTLFRVRDVLARCIQSQLAQGERGR